MLVRAPARCGVTPDLSWRDREQKRAPRARACILPSWGGGGYGVRGRSGAPRPFVSPPPPQVSPYTAALRNLQGRVVVVVVVVGRGGRGGGGGRGGAGEGMARRQIPLCHVSVT